MILGAGCSLLASDPEPSTAPASTTTSIAETTTTTRPVEPPTIEVLDPGAEPRRLLRYAMAPGRSDLFVTAGSTIRQEGGSPNPIEIVTPEIIHVVELTIGEATPDGVPLTLTVRSAHLGKSALTDAQSLGIEESLAELGGLTGSGLITTDGRLRAFRWDDTGPIDPAVRNGIDAIATQLPGLVAPLPGAAVGSGARWRARSTVTLDDAPVTVTTTYTLDGVLGSAAKYSSISETTVGRHGLPDLPDGRTVELLDSKTTAETDGILDLESLTTSATTETVAEQRIRIAGPDGPLDLTQRVESRIEISTAP